MPIKKFRTSGPVFDMRNFKREWIKGCVKIGVGEKTGPEWYQSRVSPLTISVAPGFRNLTNAGVAHATAMKITGHRTVSVFQRYNIVSTQSFRKRWTGFRTTQERRKMQSVRPVSC